MLIKSRGIVFRQVKYGETSLIVDLYTEERGLQSYIVNGVRSASSKTSAALFQPLSLVEVVAYARDDQQLNRIKEIKPAFVFRSIPFDLKKSSVGLFLIELARKAIREIEPNPGLFEFLFATILYLDHTPLSVANLPVHFMIQLADFLGFRPDGAYSGQTPCFHLQEGMFLASGSDPLLLPPAESQALSALMACQYEEGAALVIPKPLRKYLLQRMLEYYRLHLEQFPDMHTHEILEEVFT